MSSQNEIKIDETKYNLIPECEDKNHVHNILRLFVTLPNFLFTTNETRGSYY